MRFAHKEIIVLRKNHRKGYPGQAVTRGSGTYITMLSSLIALALWLRSLSATLAFMIAYKFRAAVLANSRAKLSSSSSKIPDEDFQFVQTHSKSECGLIPCANMKQKQPPPVNKGSSVSPGSIIRVVTEFTEIRPTGMAQTTPRKGIEPAFKKARVLALIMAAVTSSFHVADLGLLRHCITNWISERGFVVRIKEGVNNDRMVDARDFESVADTFESGRI